MASTSEHCQTATQWHKQQFKVLIQFDYDWWRWFERFQSVQTTRLMIPVAWRRIKHQTRTSAAKRQSWMKEQGKYWHYPIKVKLQCQSLPWFIREDDNIKRGSGQSARLEDLLFKQDLLKSMWGCVIEVTKLAVQDGTVVHWREKRRGGHDQVHVYMLFFWQRITPTINI